MVSNLTINKSKVSDRVDMQETSAPPLFWAAACFITEGDVILKEARSETEPLAFLIKFQQLGIPFEMRGNDLHLWYELPQGSQELVLDNSFSLCLVPLFLKFPFPVTACNISEFFLPGLESFIKEARRVGANIRMEGGNTVKVKPSRIRAGRFAWQDDNEVNQALVLLSLLARGKSTFLGVPQKFDWVEFFAI